MHRNVRIGRAASWDRCCLSSFRFRSPAVSRQGARGCCVSSIRMDGAEAALSSAPSGVKQAGMTRRPGLTSAPSADDEVRSASPAGFQVVEDGAGMPEPIIGYGSTSMGTTTATAVHDDGADHGQCGGEEVDERSSLINKRRSTDARVSRAQGQQSLRNVGSMLLSVSHGIADPALGTFISTCLW